MKKLFIFFVVISIALVGCNQEESIKEPKEIKAETPFTVEERQNEGYKIIKEVVKSDEIKTVVEILENAEWKENVEVVMAHPPEYRFSLSSINYAIWVTPISHRLEIIAEGQGKYIKLSIKDSEILYKIITEKEAETITKVKFEDEFTDLWNKINITLNEESPNNYYFKNMDLHNGDIFLLDGESQGLKLKKGDNVLVDLTIIPDGSSHTGVGYILEGKYTEIFFEPVSDKLTTSFDVKVDGDYIICIIGGNANFITITDGVISID